MRVAGGDEPYTSKGYRSDYDLLIREYGITGTIRTPVHVIVHTLLEVNDGLAHGRYFFMDVRRDGIALYEYGDTEFHEPKQKAPDQASALAVECFEDCFLTAAGFQRNAAYVIRDGDLKLAAFIMHQATEKLYRYVILVAAFCTPHAPNLASLRTQTEHLDRPLVEVWPRERKANRALFEKVEDACVKTRRSKHY